MPIFAGMLEKMVFIDEAHFISVDEWQDHGYFLSGSRCIAFRQNLWRKQSLTLLMAIGWGGKLHHVIKKHSKSRGVDEVDFLNFIKDPGSDGSG